jgi:hydroxyacylglutathione hydrolase
VVVEQIRVGYDNFCYVVYCSVQKKAAIVDPGFDSEKPLLFIALKHLVLNYVILTHFHSDHTAECTTIKKVFPSVKIVASAEDGRRLPLKPDVVVGDGSQLALGDSHLDFLLTPGHTKGGICVMVDGKALLTGDTLFIGDCGRTDLAGGSLQEMFASLHEKIMALPDELVVYPGHDYGEKPFDTLGKLKPYLKRFITSVEQELKKGHQYQGDNIFI